MMRKIFFLILLLNLPLFCFAQDVLTSASPKVEKAESKESAKIVMREYNGSFVPLDGSEECKKAGGKIVMLKECDGSESAACEISGKIQCYADQVKDGRCVMSMEYCYPRVLCDKEQ